MITGIHHVSAFTKSATENRYFLYDDSWFTVGEKYGKSKQYADATFVLWRLSREPRDVTDVL